MNERSFHYRLYGHSVASELELPVEETTDPAAEPLILRLRDGQDPEGEIVRLGEELTLRWGEGRIDLFVAPSLSRDDLAVHVLGTVLGLWLERGGVPMLHGAAVTAGEVAVALLGRDGAGKSSLAGACLLQGASLLADTAVALDLSPADGAVRVLPAYPRIRLWPATILHLLGPDAARRFESVHPSTTKRWVPVGGDPVSGEEGLGTFDDRARPLGAIYLPERRPDIDRPTFEPLTPAQAVIELVRHSFLARMVEALGWQPRRLEHLARVAEAVPVRRLVYPDGWQHLDDAVEALLNDLPGT